MPPHRRTPGENDAYGQRPSYYHPSGSYQGYARHDPSVHASNGQARPLVNSTSPASMLPYHNGPAPSPSYPFGHVSPLPYSSNQRPSSSGGIVSPNSYSHDNSYSQLPTSQQQSSHIFPSSSSPQEYFQQSYNFSQYGSIHSRSPSAETRLSSIPSAPPTPLNIVGSQSDFVYAGAGYSDSSMMAQPTTGAAAKPQEYRVSLNDLADPEPGQAPGFGVRVLMQYAIQGSPEGRLSLNDIYEAIERRFTYFKTDKNFRNTARHDISLHPQFVKVPRRPDEPGKGHMWTYDPTIPARPRKPRAKKPKSKQAAKSASPLYDSDASAQAKMRGNDRRSTAPTAESGSMSEVTNQITFVNLARL